MAGQYLRSPIQTTRAGSSPSESLFYWELNLLRTPSPSPSLTSVSTSQQTTLCDCRSSTETILDICSNDTSYKTTSTFKTSAHLGRTHRITQTPSSYVKPCPLSPVTIVRTPLSPSTSPLDMDSTAMASQLQRNPQRPANGRHLHLSSRHSGVSHCGDVSRSRQDGLDGLGLSLDSRSHPTALSTPVTSYSSRLRKIAPPPLQLTEPPPYSVGQQPRPVQPAPDKNSLLSPPEPSQQRPPPLQSAVTFLDLPEDHSSASLEPSEILMWRNSIPCAVDCPLSPCTLPPADARPSAELFSQEAQASTRDSDFSPLSAYTRFDDPFEHAQSPDTSISTPTAPPPLPRPYLLSLPPVPDEFRYPVHSAQLLSPIGLNFRDALTVDDIILRADKCIESVGDAALSLCSCSLLKDPEAIFDTCRSIQRVLGVVQEELDKTPEDRDFDSSEELQHWFHRHWQIMSSLERNLNLFYLFADQLRRNPPRIHRLAGHIDKLHAYHAKFTDLARRLAVSHQKLRLLRLRMQFVAEHRNARTQVDAERSRRREFRTAWYEGRIRRSAMREEIRCSRRELRSARPETLVAHSAHDDFPHNVKV